MSYFFVAGLFCMKFQYFSHSLSVYALHGVQAGIPSAYCGNVVDALLVLFTLSGLWTLKMVLGLFCDCCCPLKQIESPKEQSEQSLGNGIKAKSVKDKRGRKGKKGSH